MKTLLRILTVFLLCTPVLKAQIITPIIKANFGVDADLRNNFFNGFAQSGNDDWFKLPGTVGTGEFMIDTTGVAALMAGYTTNPNSRKLPFYRNMRFPAYSVVNNRLLIDAVFVRDYHGDDSTIFASGSNKNGMSPANWSCPVSQSVPDKNEILDMMLHVRRAGPNVTDSMWLFGGLSIENTTGNRYFDFELWQTDIYYDRASRQFYNYGPDAGHTSWKFDASGNITAPGEIILTAEYGSSSLTAIEARIWINKDDLLKTPTSFNWTGSFDGASSGAQYGYAGIQPKTAGAFYTGLQSVNNTWAGPFGLVLGDNSVQTNYVAKQFMEFSVNMSKLGLDQANIFGGDDCTMPFRRVVVKTRASTSFTAELKDFIAPFDFFMAPRAVAETTTPYICDTGSVSNIYVMNPLPTSIYQWSTLNGNFVGSTTGTSVYVDTPGVYIVKQYLQENCSEYATDTIEVYRFNSCTVLNKNLFGFNGSLHAQDVQLEWKVLYNQVVRYFDIERSIDGINFISIGRVMATAAVSEITAYNFTDNLEGNNYSYVYYRVKMKDVGTEYRYSPVISFNLRRKIVNDVTIVPNPAKNHVQIQLMTEETGTLRVVILNQAGQVIKHVSTQALKGFNIITIDDLTAYPAGIYQAVIYSGSKIYNNKLMLIR